MSVSVEGLVVILVAEQCSPLTPNLAITQCLLSPLSLLALVSGIGNTNRILLMPFNGRGVKLHRYSLAQLERFEEVEYITTCSKQMHVSQILSNSLQLQGNKGSFYFKHHLIFFVLICASSFLTRALVPRKVVLLLVIKV